MTTITITTNKGKIVAELEVEHSVSSAGDPGEVAIEQAYVERQLNATYALRAGLFLMPIGLLNENHEPTAFYGVERNFVETVELQIGLKNYDPQRDKRFSGTVKYVRSNLVPTHFRLQTKRRLNSIGYRTSPDPA